MVSAAQVHRRSILEHVWRLLRGLANLDLHCVVLLTGPVVPATEIPTHEMFAVVRTGKQSFFKSYNSIRVQCSHRVDVYKPAEIERYQRKVTFVRLIESHVRYDHGTQHEGHVRQLGLQPCVQTHVLIVPPGSVSPEQPVQFSHLVPWPPQGSALKAKYLLTPKLDGLR